MEAGGSFTIGEAARRLGLPVSTIRYYEKSGLLPNQTRSAGGTRLFDEDDMEWFRFLDRLKVSGMPVKEMREYVELYLRGDETIEQRLEIVRARREAIDAQIAELELARDFIDYKCWFYEVASEAGSCDVPRNMPREELPERIRIIKDRCEISRY